MERHLRLVPPPSRKTEPPSRLPVDDEADRRRAIRLAEQKARTRPPKPHPLARQARRLLPPVGAECVDREPYEMAVELSFKVEHSHEELEHLIAGMNATTLWIFLTHAGPFVDHAEAPIMNRLDALRQRGGGEISTNLALSAAPESEFHCEHLRTHGDSHET